MIFYFSGTGNSYHAAKTIAKVQGDQIVSIAQELDKGNGTLEYKLGDNELLGFVYPIYAWAPPKLVLDFISRMKVTGGKPYIFSVSICGDEEGKNTNLLQKELHKSGLPPLNSAFTIRMPNNYIIGYDVDPKDVKSKKLELAEKRLSEINSVLTKRQTGVFQLIPGTLAGFKTNVINPLFNKFAMKSKPFYATDNCTKCGLCERICPIHTIKVTDKPVWGKSCTQCLACIHRCPVHAIQYGKGTISKGRYVHPSILEK